MTRAIYKPEYGTSWALIIGIDKYRNAPPLQYACSDAKAVALALTSEFGFAEDHVTLLLDEDATVDRIRSSFLSFTSDEISPDDRLIVFYAGHGHTREGYRGEIGFLVPFDGNADDLPSLLRWDYMTRNAELIKAKHVLFVMDACYGGLALTRGVSGGSVRFLQDMLQRYSRQVLTAGKADEVVADSGGPLPNHSVFTGHFLEGLQGKAAYGGAIVTANTLMSYVYEHVAKDPHSNQTPHYGFLDGDGDFIFSAPVLESGFSPERKGNDVLFEIPATTAPAYDETSNLVELAKELIADSTQRIRLHDAVVTEIRRVMIATNEDEFPVQTTGVTPEEFAARLRKYEETIRDMLMLMLCLSYWGEPQHPSLMEKCVSRLTDHFIATGGKAVWLNLRWYPTMLLVYAGGIGAIAAERYDNLAEILLARIPSLMESDRDQAAVLTVGNASLELERADAFKLLPGHNLNYAPRSEYLLKVLQPPVEEVLFCGKAYESLFDRYEIVQALVYADLNETKSMDIWGPIGRFGWKYGIIRREKNPFTTLVKEGANLKDDWPLVKAGLFRGSYERFLEVATKYEELLMKLNWF